MFCAQYIRNECNLGCDWARDWAFIRESSLFIGRGRGGEGGKWEEVNEVLPLQIEGLKSFNVEKGVGMVKKVFELKYHV